MIDADGVFLLIARLDALIFIYVDSISLLVSKLYIAHVASILEAPDNDILEWHSSVTSEGLNAVTWISASFGDFMLL